MKPHLFPHAGVWCCMTDDLLVCAATAREAFTIWYCARILNN